MVLKFTFGSLYLYQDVKFTVVIPTLLDPQRLYCKLSLHSSLVWLCIPST